MVLGFKNYTDLATWPRKKSDGSCSDFHKIYKYKTDIQTASDSYYHAYAQCAHGNYYKNTIIREKAISSPYSLC